MPSPDKIKQQINEHSVSLENFRPGASSYDNHSLKNKLGGEKVIGAGDATHSSREFNRLRHQIFQLLVEELDYRIFAWEASFGETLEINNYVWMVRERLKKH
ncbi:hypothetical protein GLU64_01045 [Nanohaloarchaea archaeon]|nr:hypothetical protein [Candidatus Nanohaloarchaea archaeon]